MRFEDVVASVRQAEEAREALRKRTEYESRYYQVGRFFHSGIGDVTSLRVRWWIFGAGAREPSFAVRFECYNSSNLDLETAPAAVLLALFNVRARLELWAKGIAGPPLEEDITRALGHLLAGQELIR